MKYVCIHGHYYQPPRESPWTDVLPAQPSAAPFRDWNVRITNECYGPNLRARLLDDDGRVRAASNNYQKTSFNFGPTLLRWLERSSPWVYRRLTSSAADNAIAQVYSHMILPLAHPRDRVTQVRWGVRDFEHRFGRRPRGMWLAETAVCTASLEALAAEGIAFTILAPRQVKGDVDKKRAHRVRLPSGKDIAVFVYDGELAQAVAFDGLLNSGDTFAARVAGAFDDDDDDPQLVHIATDGESYGHHHRYGEMALARCLELLAKDHELVSYARFLERHPPTSDVEIVEQSSWSCAHGVERWRSDCGCRMSGGSQAWRAPLRAAFDNLRDAIFSVGEALFDDVWAARDAYIDVELGRVAGASRFMEAMKHAMFMYTSCGWFFDDVDGLEPKQCMAHALYASELVAEWLPGAQAQLLEDLEAAEGGRRAATEVLAGAFSGTLVRAARAMVESGDGAHVAWLVERGHELGFEVTLPEVQVAFLRAFGGRAELPERLRDTAERLEVVISADDA